MNEICFYSVGTVEKNNNTSHLMRAQQNTGSQHGRQAHTEGRMCMEEYSEGGYFANYYKQRTVPINLHWYMLKKAINFDGVYLGLCHIHKKLTGTSFCCDFIFLTKIENSENLDE